MQVDRDGYEARNGNGNEDAGSVRHGGMSSAISFFSPFWSLVLREGRRVTPGLLISPPSLLAPIVHLCRQSLRGAAGSGPTFLDILERVMAGGKPRGGGREYEGRGDGGSGKGR